MTERDFRTFHDRNRANFENFARVMARRNEVVAGDAFADALASAWIKFSNKPLTEEIEAHMKGYTFRCIKNFVLKWYRDSRTRGKFFDVGLDGAENVAGSLADTPERMMELLDEKLSKLPPKFEAAVRLCCLKNPPVAMGEAASILGVSVATLYRMLNDAKNRLSEESANFNYRINLPKGAVS